MLTGQPLFHVGDFPSYMSLCLYLKMILSLLLVATNVLMLKTNKTKRN